MNIDFDKHVALVAVLDLGGRQTIVGGGRYVVVRPGTAEVTFAVVHEFQATLMRHLITIAREAGLKEFIADVLPDNAAMLKSGSGKVGSASCGSGRGQSFCCAVYLNDMAHKH